MDQHVHPSDGAGDLMGRDQTDSMHVLADVRVGKGPFVLGAILAVAAGALYLAFRGEDLSRIGQMLISLNPWIVLLGAGVFVINQVLFVYASGISNSTTSASAGF